MDEEGKVKGTQIFLVIIALIMLIIAIIAFLWEYTFHKMPNYITVALSIGTILLSLYFIFQITKKPQNILFEQQKVSTVLRCVNCDYVSARGFEKGDYIFKEVGACPRCGSSLIIYSVFREVKEKEQRSE